MLKNEKNKKNKIGLHHLLQAFAPPRSNKHQIHAHASRGVKRFELGGKPGWKMPTGHCNGSTSQH